MFVGLSKLDLQTSLGRKRMKKTSKKNKIIPYILFNKEHNRPIFALLDNLIIGFHGSRDDCPVFQVCLLRLIDILSYKHGFYNYEYHKKC